MENILKSDRPRRIYTIWRRIAPGIEVFTPYGPIALNDTARMAWEMMDGTSSVEDIVLSLRRAHPGVDEKTLLADLEGLLVSLRDKGMIVIRWPPEDWEER